MEASKMESTAAIQEEREKLEREKLEREKLEREARKDDDVPEQSGANDQNRTDVDPPDLPAA
jgi:hypothetical protein